MRYLFLTLSGVIFLMACTTDVTISMDDGNPPTFKFSRNFSEVNNLPFFDVIQIVPENESLAYHQQQFDRNVTLWRIVPEKAGTTIDQLRSITYGQVPTGFIQQIPEDGSPAPLLEGKLYQAGGPPVMMRRALLRFAIRNGKAVRIPVPD
jgi:hypothetical protein